MVISAAAEFEEEDKPCYVEDYAGDLVDAHVPVEEFGSLAEFFL